MRALRSGRCCPISVAVSVRVSGHRPRLHDRSFDETIKNATRTTYVVTRDQIARYGYRTVGEALQSVPGVKILPYGPLGASVNYGIRGSSTAQELRSSTVCLHPVRSTTP